MCSSLLPGAATPRYCRAERGAALLALVEPPLGVGDRDPDLTARTSMRETFAEGAADGACRDVEALSEGVGAQVLGRCRGVDARERAVDELRDHRHEVAD